MHLTLPIYWVDKKKTIKDKTYLVGLNQLFSMHYQVRNKLKQHFHSLVGDQVTDATPILGQFTVTYTLYYKNVVSDPSNIIAGVEKVLLDGLQEHGMITEDNPKYHLGTSWTVAKQDKTNPRVEVTIQESL